MSTISFPLGTNRPTNQPEIRNSCGFEEKAEPNSQPSSIVVHSPKSALAEHRAESTNNRPGKHIGKVCRIEAMTGAYVDAWLHKKLVQVCDSSHVCVQTMVLVDAIPF